MCVDIKFQLRNYYSRKREEAMEVTGRQGRKGKQLLDAIKEMKGYCQLKQEALDCTLWRTGFGRGFGPVVRQIME